MRTTARHRAFRVMEMPPERFVMTNRQLRRYEMLFRVNEFGNARRDRFPEGSVGGRAFATVAEAVVQLRDRAVVQLALKREGARARRAARAALLETLESIGRTARVLQRDAPAFPNSFRLPERMSAQAVLTAARLFVRDIEPVATQFVEHGMPETFVADLTGLLANYEQAIRRREVGKGESAAARASIDAAIDQAVAAARRLDVIIANRLRDDAATVAEWQRARRVAYARRSAPKVDNAEQPSATSPTVPMPVPAPAPQPQPQLPPQSPVDAESIPVQPAPAPPITFTRKVS
jgi:hypothetical protein